MRKLLNNTTHTGTRG